MGGFLNSLFDDIGQHFKEKHDQEQEIKGQQKKAEFDTLWGSLQKSASRIQELKDKGDKASPEEMKEVERLSAQYKWSMDALGKLTKSNKPLNEALGKLGQLTTKVLTHKGQKKTFDAGPSQPPQGQPPAAQPPSPDQQQGAQGPASKPPGMSVTDQQPAPQAAAPAAQAKQAFNDGPSMQGAMAAADDTNVKAARARDDAKFKTDERIREDNAKSGNKVKEEQARPGTQRAKKDVTFVGPEGKRIHLKQDPATLQVFNQDGSEAQIPEGYEPASNTTLQKMLYKLKGEDDTVEPHTGYVDPKDPSRKLDATTGQPIEDMATVIDPSSYGAKLRSDAYGKTGTYQQYYASFIAQKYSPQEAAQYAGQLTEEYLNKRLDYLGAGREVQAVGPGGTPIAQPLQRVPTGPATSIPPPSGASGGQSAPSPTPASKPATSGAAPTSASKPEPAQGAAHPTAAPSGARPLPGMSAGQYNAAQRIITPLSEATVQAFGDPDHPEVKGLSDFSKLAAMPPADQKRVANAVNMVMDELDRDTGGQGVSASVGPISVNSGGFGQWAANAFGLTPKIVDQLNKFRADALKSLKTPEEREYLDALISNFSTIGGLRFASGGSPALMNVRSIQKELPVVGSNVNNPQDYMDKMQRIGFIITNAAKGNEFLMDRQYPQLMSRLNAAIKGGKKEPAKAPSTKSSSKSEPDIKALREKYKY